MTASGTFPGNGHSQWGAAVVAADGSVLAAAPDGEVVEWDVGTGRAERHLLAPAGRGDESTVRFVEVSPDGAAAPDSPSALDRRH